MGCNCRCKESCCSELVRPVGSWVALVTPFTNDDKVDMEGFARLVDFHVANGSDGVIFLGSTGEATSLSIDEKKEIIRAMAPYCKGKIPAYFGVTCPTTKDTVALAQLVEECGGDGVMMVVPPYRASAGCGVRLLCDRGEVHLHRRGDIQQPQPRDSQHRSRDGDQAGRDP